MAHGIADSELLALGAKGYVVIIFIVPGRLALFHGWKNALEYGGHVGSISNNLALVCEGKLANRL
jgi:hypothetical protein